MVSSQASWFLASALVISRGALAAPCAPAAVVAGDPTLAAAVGELLGSHGIESTESTECPAVHAQVMRRGDAIVVTRISPGSEPTAEHLVSELATAATVIESWTRDDLEAVSLISSAHTTPALDYAGPPAVTRLAAPPAPRVRAFGAFETSFADDRSGWVGMVVGGCVQVGVVCASVRGRFAAVAFGARAWNNIERHAVDVLVGGDIPLRFGATTLSFGFGAGMGSTHTGLEEAHAMRGTETFGLRADAHVAWAIPIFRSLALDLSASIDASQVTDVETSSTAMLASEPWMLARIAAGLRLGAR
ncbi:hypothetical protein BH11MYX3_BH11MYX3_39540 [soil metagenome]